MQVSERVRTPFDCGALTIMPDKLEQYWHEPGGYLAAGLAAAERTHGSQLPVILSQLAVLVVMPDAIARRLAEDCLSFVEHHGFVPILAVPFHITLDMSRTLWRFQFNAITPESRVIGEGVYCKGQSLMLLLKDVRRQPMLPASSRLTGLKGSSDPAKRARDSLRHTLGAINPIFGCVHCPDEPLDIVRESAILLAEPTLSRLHERLGRAFREDARYDCRAEIDEVYGANPAHDIEPERALLRLRTAIAEAGSAGGRARRLMAMIAEAAAPGRTLNWFTFSAELRDLGIEPDGWDPLLVGSYHTDYERRGAVKLIASLSSV